MALQPKDTRYSVTLGQGLSLRIHPTGTKSWVFRTSSHGTVSDIILGHFPETTLLKAKQLTREKQKELGKKPIKGYTFYDAFRLWCDIKKGTITSYKAEKRRLEKNVIPFIGTRSLDEIYAPLIIQILKPLTSLKKVATANRLAMRIKEILDFAVCAGYIKSNPLSKFNKMFETKQTKNLASLSWKKLPNIMEVIATADKKIQILFLWSLCSLLRPIETVKIKKEYIEGSILVLPAEIMKKRRIHRVPLTPFMQQLLQLANKEYNHPRSSYIFSGRKAGTCISSQTLTKWFYESDLSGKIVAHGIRALGRTWLKDKHCPFEIGECFLAHLVGNETTKAYLRTDYLEERTRWMYRWNSYIYNCAQKAGIIENLGLNPST